MDTITHTVLGAAIGEAILGKKIGKKAMLWGALASNLPDIDILFTPVFNPVDALFFHRGITHSFIFVIIISPLLGWFFSKFYREKYATLMADWTKMFFVAILVHSLLDSCTMYGTGIFEPFSHYRAQFTSLFIIDPAFTLPLVIGFIALLVLKRNSSRRKFWTKAGLLPSAMYLLFTFYNKFYVDKIFSGSLQKQNIRFSDYITTPTPLNNVLWNVAAKDTSGYWVGFYSHFDKSKDIKFFFIPRNDSLAGDLINNYAIQQLIRFSNGYYCFTKTKGDLRFNDLRFAFAGEYIADKLSADNHNAGEFVFSFGLKKDNSAACGIQIQRNPWRKARFLGFSKLIERIKGI